MGVVIINEVTMAVDVAFQPSERELSRSEEEESLLRGIREQKEKLWCEIQVSVDV